MSASNRRQPTRSARTATTRPANYYAKTWSKGQAQQEEAQEPVQHGFFPAITHFTDGVAALPKEVMRQFTLLKETEGKAFPPEQAMGEIIDKINQLPPPPSLPQQQSQPHDQAYFGFSLNNSFSGSAPASIIDDGAPPTQPSQSELSDPPSVADEHMETRRGWYHQLRYAMSEMSGALDEKNLVLTTINETLTRQLSRLESTLPYVEKEVSEEARLGSNTHWALPHMREARKAVGQTNERNNRRDMLATNNLAAAAAAVHETDIAAVRGDARREAMGHKRRNNVDSDFDERQPNKKPNTANKGKRPQASTNDPRAGNKDQPTKKRRVDKGPPAADRAMGAPQGRISNPQGFTGFRGTGAEPRKKPRPAQASGTSKKKPPANSPSIASSPIRGTFSTNNRREYSPVAPPQRPAPRARQNSALSVRSAITEQAPRNGPPSYHPKATTNGDHISNTELHNIANVTGKTLNEAKTGMRDVYTTVDGSRMMEQDGVHGALAFDNSDPSRTLKREETEPADENGYADPRMRGAGVHKSSIPMQSVETDAQPVARTRGNRGNGNSHRPNAKQPGAASSPALNPPTFPRRAHNKRHGRSPPPSDFTHDEEDEGVASDAPASSADPDEPLYCFCNQPSSGSMVGCDNPKCVREWFHLECVGLTVEPPHDAKWYCEECKHQDTTRRGRSNGRS